MNNVLTHKSRLTVRADLRFLSSIRNFIYSESLNAGIMNEQIINKFMLSTEESCSNLIRHSLTSSDSITITVIYNDKFFDIYISDTGKPFNPLNYTTSNIEQHVNSFSRGGLGIFITRKLTDKIEYTSNDGINTLKLIWKI